MFTCGIVAQIFLDKSQLSCVDLIEPKSYCTSQEKDKENGRSNEHYHLPGNF